MARMPGLYDLPSEEEMKKCIDIIKNTVVKSEIFITVKRKCSCEITCKEECYGDICGCLHHKSLRE